MAVAAGGGPATAGSASGAASMDASGGMLNR
jgi:hypothetical protein